MKRAIVLGFLSLVILGGCARRPNILLIVTDDQRWDERIDYMPNVRGQFADGGVWFTNAYVTTPLCCPSRASIFTGLLSTQTGVRENEDPLDLPTFARRLQASGYYTGLIGKYLNSWDGSPRPEFDYWASMPFGGVTSYSTYVLDVNGQRRLYCPPCAYSGYLTAVLVEQARAFLAEAAERPRPFLLILTPIAPHSPSEPDAPERSLDVDAFVDDDLSAPSVDEADTSDKPAAIRSLPLVSLDDVRERARAQVRTLISLDRHLGPLLSDLAGSGVLDRTALLFLSDNGLYWGEHRLFDQKSFPYEEAVHVPFGFRYPPWTSSSSSVRNELVANIDVAPTVYDLARLRLLDEVAGRSLRGVFDGSSWRSHLPIWISTPAVQASGIHTGRDRSLGPDFGYVWMLQGGEEELYDLQADPHQLSNVASDPSYESVRTRLSALASPPPPTLRIESPQPKATVDRSNGFGVDGTFEAGRPGRVASVEVQAYDASCQTGTSVYGPVPAALQSTNGNRSGTWSSYVPGDLATGCRMRVTARAIADSAAPAAIDAASITFEPDGRSAPKRACGLLGPEPLVALVPIARRKRRTRASIRAQA